MKWSKDQILGVLDSCTENFTFPMLDNGYTYLADCRLSLFRSQENWQLAVEVFGFSPRAMIPDVQIFHFGNNIQRRKDPDNFVSVGAFEKYLENNPYNEFDAAFPLSEGDWIDERTADTVVPGRSVLVRTTRVQVPSRSEYKAQDIDLESSNEIFIHEFCRYLSSTHRDLVLSTDKELRNLVSGEMDLVLTLDAWNHPDIVDPENRPSTNETFQQLADVLETGNVSRYKPTVEPNTHWKNWPEGGTL